MLEYFVILVLLISEEKRSARRLAWAIENDPIFTSGLQSSTNHRQKKVSRPDDKIESSSVAHARRRAERFSSDIKRKRIKITQAQARSLGKPWY